MAGESANHDDYTSAYDAARYLIGHRDDQESSFSLEDLLGDIDAFNLGNMLVNITQPLNRLIRSYYEDERYKARFSLFFENRFSNDANLLQSQATYVLNSDEPIILEMRGVLRGGNHTDEQGEEVSRAFKDIVVQKANED